jgi:hypothetical protein
MLQPEGTSGHFFITLRSGHFFYKRYGTVLALILHLLFF